MGAEGSLASVDRDKFRNAMARLGAAVNIITTDGPAGRAGFTASAVCSVTDDPPTLLVCMNRSSEQYAVFKTNGIMCVNTVAPDHQDLSLQFAVKGRDMEACFAANDWSRLATGAPVLAEAAVSFDCVIESLTDIGTHSVFFGKVADIRIGEGAGLIYFARGFHPVGLGA